MTKSEIAWQKVEQATSEVRRCYDEYIKEAQAEGLIPECNTVYHIPHGFIRGYDIMFTGLHSPIPLPDKKPNLKYVEFTNNGNVLDRHLPFRPYEYCKYGKGVVTIKKKGERK